MTVLWLDGGGGWEVVEHLYGSYSVYTQYTPTG